MNRIFLLSALLCCTMTGGAQESIGPMAANKLAAAKFATLPNVPDCFTVAVERGDPGKGPSSVMVKMAPACDSRIHWHSANASVLAVSGSTQLAIKGAKTVSLLRGDFVFMPAHHIHGEKCAGTAPCIFFVELYGPFDVHYVDGTGKEITTDEALRGAKKSGN